MGELADAIVESGKGQACLVRNYFRFSFARNENLDADGCTLERLRMSLTDRGRGSIKQMLREVALTPAFAQRTFE